MTSSAPMRSWSITVMTNSVSSGKDTVSSNTLKHEVVHLEGHTETGGQTETERYRLSKRWVELFGDVSIFGVQTLVPHLDYQVWVSLTIRVRGGQTGGLQDTNKQTNDAEYKARLCIYLLYAQ